jgi:hypothetical protein
MRRLVLEWIVPTTVGLIGGLLVLTLVSEGGSGAAFAICIALLGVTLLWPRRRN